MWVKTILFLTMFGAIAILVMLETIIGKPLTMVIAFGVGVACCIAMWNLPKRL